MAEKITKPELVVLIRHGESFTNAARKNNVYFPDEESANQIKRIRDHDIPLTEIGHGQAVAIGPYLKNRFGIFDVVYNSGYLRTEQTQDGAMSAYTEQELKQTKFRTSHLLAERSRGYTYSMTTDEVDRHFPYLKEHFEVFGPFYAEPPGGESLKKKCDDVYMFNGMMFRHRAGLKTAIFMHGGTIRAERYNLEGWTVKEFEEDVKKGSAENASITVYQYNQKTSRLELIEYNTVVW
jgi:2,3-bisphosphoglycerate-dependent phosphoglycerate mutase